MISIVISCAALLVSVITAIFAHKTNRSDREEEFAIAWTNKVITWASEATDALSEIEHVVRCTGNPVEENHRDKFAKLSSLIDRGRLLFENDRSDGYGKQKYKAYQGYRPVLLDSLVDVYDRFEAFFAGSVNESSAGISRRGIVADEMRYDRQIFVSEIQSIVNPIWFQTKAKQFNREVENVKNN